MATEQTSGRPGGAVAEVKEKGEELVSSTQEQLSTKAHELGEDLSFQVREQLDRRSTQRASRCRRWDTPFSRVSSSFAVKARTSLRR